MFELTVASVILIWNLTVQDGYYGIRADQRREVIIGTAEKSKYIMRSTVPARVGQFPPILEDIMCNVSLGCHGPRLSEVCPVELFDPPLIRPTSIQSPTGHLAR
jgi:hypothetical protein